MAHVTRTSRGAHASPGSVSGEPTGCGRGDAGGSDDSDGVELGDVDGVADADAELEGWSLGEEVFGGWLCIELGDGLRDTLGRAVVDVVAERLAGRLAEGLVERL